MIERLAFGELPKKHHTVLRGPEGKLRWEECWTRRGFDGPYTILYHENRPHEQVTAEVRHGFSAPEAAKVGLKKRHFVSPRLPARSGANVDARVPLLFNDDVTIGVSRFSEPDPVYFSNGDADDLYFVFEGSGVVRTMLGDLRYGKDDYVAVPRGCLHRFVPDAGAPQYLLSLELKGGLRIPSQWRNEHGQLRMDAPYSHRDFRAPRFSGPIDEGIREIVVKKGDAFHGFSVPRSPLDVVGWDGSVYPFVFPILSFQPRAGLVHLPPDWHGTFASTGALVCSFVPRVVDFHPEAIPCPYPHASVDCDEFLFYVRGNFTSRRGVGPGSISFHPAGVPHGPHPGAYEASLGAKETSELAVMLDTVKPLRLTPQALSVEDAAYEASFLEG